nr:uncharacterized protein LOC118969043 [Manis javanica]
MTDRRLAEKFPNGAPTILEYVGRLPRYNSLPHTPPPEELSPTDPAKIGQRTRAPTACKVAAGTDSRRSQRLSPHRRRKRKPPPVLASSPSCPVSPRLLRGTSPHHADARRSPQGAPPLLGVCVRTGDASAQGGLALGRGANAALGFPGPCLRPRKPTRPPETSHLHCAPAERPQVPAPRPLPRRGPRPALSGTAAGRTPALPALYAGLRVRRWPPCLLPGPPLPRPRGFLTRENTGRWTDAQRHRIPDWPQRQGKHDRQLPTSTAGPRPFLTCLHGIREVVPRGCCPGKLLQFPGAEVQPPGVGRFLQGALEPPVQGQVEDPAAAAAAAASPDPAAGPGSCVCLLNKETTKPGHQDSPRSCLLEPFSE